jgi:hypothetical protein
MLPSQDNGRTRALENQHAANKVRLLNPGTQEFLHMSGKGVTKDITWSWLGHRYQAETLRRNAMARGADWPFQPIHRALVDANSGAGAPLGDYGQSPAGQASHGDTLI